MLRIIGEWFCMHGTDGGLIYMYRGFTIAGNFLPKFLADRGAAANESTYVTYRN